MDWGIENSGGRTKALVIEEERVEAERAANEAERQRLHEAAMHESEETLPMPLPSETEVAEQPWTMAQGKSTTKGRAAGVMLVAGSSPDYIAEVLGFSSGAAARRQAMKALSEALDFTDKEAIKDLLGSRLEALFRSAFRRAQDPRYKNPDAAMNSALSIIDRQMKLFGVAAPTTVMVGTATDAEIRDFVTRVAAEKMAALPKEKDVIRGEVAS